MTTTTTTLTAESIATDLLDSHPQNPHGKLSEKDARIQELRALIEKHGQTQAGLVRPKGDRFEIVIGHRRAFVCELLGIDFLAVVRELADDVAIALMLSDNESHERPDPFLEAAAVQQLMNPLFKWTVRDVADLLGKPVRWVAQRANLLELSSSVRKALKANEQDNPFARWPIAMLEEYAKLPKEQQDELLGDGRLYDVFTMEDLSRELRDQFHLLGKAPWDLADASLCPSAGSCTACPKTSLRSPGLFDEDLDDPDVKKATCRDGECWKAKSDAHTIRAIGEVREKHPGALLVKSDSALRHDLPDSIAHQAVSSYDVSKVKKSTPGAVPAVFVGGDKGPVVEYVLAKKDTPAKKKADKAKAASNKGDEKERLRASKEQVGKRRRAWVVDEIRTRIENLDKTPASLVKGGSVLGLVAAYSLHEPDDLYNSAAPKDRKKIYDVCAGSMERFTKEVWPRLQEKVAETLRRFRPDDLDQQHTAATWVAELVEIDVKAISEKAVATIPDPKWWGSADVKENVTKTVRAKTPANKVAEAATPGVCRGCGCTDKKACPEGCHWVELPDPDGLKKNVDGRFLPMGLCSSCGGSQPAGKKSSKKKAKS